MASKTVTVIGGGPGGYVAAIRAAQLGAQVTLIEKAQLGGTCLNTGCIPTKALLDSAHAFYLAGHAAEIGVEAVPTLRWDNVQRRRTEVIHRLVSGVEGLMRANRIQVLKGEASFRDAHHILVKQPDGKVQECSSDYYVIATGSVAAVPPIPGIDPAFCMDSTKALELDHVPKSMVVVGGGVIGVELATAYQQFGCKVTIVEMADHILPNMDTELSDRLRKDLEASGVQILTSTKVLSFAPSAVGGSCRIEQAGKELQLDAEKMLICIGRRANFEGLHPEKAGIKTDRVIPVNAYLQTNVAHIYAIGDCNGLLMLAHAASEQGVAAAENCMGGNRTFDARLCPSGVYATPELAGVGLTEDQAKAQGIDYRVGTFPSMANGRSLILQQTTGLVKVLIGEPYGEILGVHIYGAQATELIAEAALAMKLEATAEELADTIHAHPTLSECIHEAALASLGRTIHMPNRK